MIPRTSALMIVLNGMPWLPYTLRAIYPFMTQMVIVEGAVEDSAEVATPDGHSLDDTLATIRAFPDPDRKITLIQRDGHWPDKDVMCAAGTEALTGDLLWQVDVDEFYQPDEMRWIQTTFAKRPEIEAATFQMIDFWGGMRAIMRGGRYADRRMNHAFRVFRWQKGSQYIRHEPVIVLSPDGRDLREGTILAADDLARRHGIYMYHYSYVFPEQVRRKAVYYEKMAVFTAAQGVYPVQWVPRHYEKLTPLRVHMDRRPASWLEPFRRQHPPAIQDFIRDLEAGTIRMEQRPDADLRRLLDSGRWRFWKRIGQIDGILWRFWDGPVRRMLRPLVRPLRARFFGYEYSGEEE